MPISSLSSTFAYDSTGLLLFEADCLGDPSCQVSVFTFQDKAADDLAETALFDFFDALTVTDSYYISFKIGIPGAGESRTWCTDKANTYVSQHQQFSPTFGIRVFGPWPKWYRSPATGGAWTSTTDAHINTYGTSCAEAYSWCSEMDIGGDPTMRLGVRPGGPNDCEIFRYEPVPVCSDGTWRLTIKVGPSRMSACGF